MASTVLLLGFALTAAITDFWRHKIYNWTTVPGMIAGLVVSTFEPNGIGWEDSVLGFMGCGLIMVCCFLSFQMGAGDVKLIAMLATFLGWYHGLECMLWSFVLGAALGLSMLIWKFGVLKLISWLVRQVWSFIRYWSWLPLTDEEREALKARLYLAPASFVAVIIVRFSWFH